MGLGILRASCAGDSEAAVKIAAKYSIRDHTSEDHRRSGQRET